MSFTTAPMPVARRARPVDPADLAAIARQREVSAPQREREAAARNRIAMANMRHREIRDLMRPSNGR